MRLQAAPLAHCMIDVAPRKEDCWHRHRPESPMNTAASALALLALAAAAPADREAMKRLDRGCEIVQQAYPALMLAAMAEGPMNCGTPEEPVDCDANDSPEEAAKQAKRLEIRKRQEKVFKMASEACDLYS